LSGGAYLQDFGLNEQRITYHFVWAPMRSKPCLIGRAANRLMDLLRERALDLEVELEDVRVFPDRVYVAVAAPPVLSPHRIICQLKAHSSRCLRHEFTEMTKIPTVWTRAYLVVAGDGVTPDEAIAAFEAAQPPKRGPGRPRACECRDSMEDLRTHA
jgi:putative transposase